jgi:D-xylulose reductase
MKETDGWGADAIFESSGVEEAAAEAFSMVLPDGRVGLIGPPPNPVAYDVVAASAKEAR